ncbi:suppressor of fused domain protein [Bordetella sp. 2513F-2]
MTTSAPDNRPSTPPSPQRKVVARHALSVFGGKPVVHAWHHDTLDLSIDILEVDDSPDDGLVSYSTLGLFELDLRHDDGSPMNTQIELCAEAPQDQEEWAGILSAAAFSLMRSGQAVRPGSVLTDCVAEYYPDTTVPHLYLCVPFSWNEAEFPRLEFDETLVNWLQVIPISDAERAFVEQEGAEAFEDALLEQDPDIYALDRDSLF